MDRHGLRPRDDEVMSGSWPLCSFAPSKQGTRDDNDVRHCERSAAIHVFGTQKWIATACGIAMTSKPPHIRH
jgi:hypothetical protein